ncbi:MAG: hypothetical protein ACO1NW_00365 [Chitinophagaceae bacterium]
MKGKIIYLAFSALLHANAFAQVHTASNGNVGIGTAYPHSKLHVSSTSNQFSFQNVPDNSLITVGGHNNVFDGQYINFKNPSNTDYPDIYWWSSDILFGRFKNVARWAFKENHGGTLGTQTKDIISATLNDDGGYTHLSKLILAPDNGNVGIGTSNPQAKLAVNGDIFSRKVKVTQTGWSDFVFAPAYKLRPLHEVKSFIHQHRHLPDVPSEKEVIENGQDLGEMNKILLQKVEELTLYIIQMREELDELKKNQK